MTKTTTRALRPHRSTPSTWDSFDDAAHFLQDTHGEHIAHIVLTHAGRGSEPSAP